MKVVDNEIGYVPDFNNFGIVQEKHLNHSLRPNKGPADNEPETIQLIPQIKNSTEVYYDSRSGSRYTVENGTREKLPESGAVVINSGSPFVPTNKARSTFFGVFSHKQH